jgi:DNA modification methylase
MDVDKIYTGNALEVLKTFPANCVDTVVTSSPYYGLRNYSTEPQIWDGDENCKHTWVDKIKKGITGGKCVLDGAGKAMTEARYTPDSKHAYCSQCSAWRGELGGEPTPELFIKHLVDIFREVKRVLKPTGVIFVNIGDSYCGGGRGADKKYGEGRDPDNHMVNFIKPTGNIKPKDLIGIPWMLSFALRDDGWYLRSEIIWFKRNPMPESVTDRPTRAHEQIFLLSKKPTYYYDAEAIKEPAAYDGRTDTVYKGGPKDMAGGKHERWPGKMENGDPSRNKRSVWDVTTKPFSGAHFAVFPEDLISPCILAGSSEKGVCPDCGKPWERILEKNSYGKEGWGPAKKDHTGSLQGSQSMIRDGNGAAGFTETKTIGWHPTCNCGKEPIPSVILDPFMGAGTTAVVAKKLSRHYVGIDLNENYIVLANKRLYNELGLFSNL